MQATFYKNYLLGIFHQRRKKNPAYSLRAYARDLNIGHTSLSGLLNGTRFLSFKRSFQIAENLHLSKELQYLFIHSILQEKIQLGHQKIEKDFYPYLPTTPGDKTATTFKIQSNQYQLFSEWYYFAILELTEIDHFKTNTEWIAKKLNITIKECQSAIDLLFQLDLLKEFNGKWEKTSKHFTGPDKDKTNQALKKRQKSILQKSIESIDKDPIDERSHNAMTFAINRDKLPQAKQEIRNFLFKMSDLLEVEKKDELYELQVSLFPLGH